MSAQRQRVKLSAWVFLRASPILSQVLLSKVFSFLNHGQQESIWSEKSSNKCFSNPTPLTWSSSRRLRTNACLEFSGPIFCWPLLRGISAGSSYHTYSNNLKKMKFKASDIMNTCCSLCSIWSSCSSLLVELHISQHSLSLSCTVQDPSSGHHL